MSGSIKGWGLAVSILVAAVIVAGCSSPASPSGPQSPPGSNLKVPTNGLVQSNTGGAVTIDVEWEGERNGLVFSVSMNTHSVDLDGYDLGEMAVLRDDEGNEYHPDNWDSATGGHHRSGTLIFPLPDSLSQGKAKHFEMVIRDVAGVEERVLRWELE